MYGQACANVPMKYLLLVCMCIYDPLRMEYSNIFESNRISQVLHSFQLAK